MSLIIAKFTLVFVYVAQRRALCLEYSSAKPLFFFLFFKSFLHYYYIYAKESYFLIQKQKISTINILLYFSILFSKVLSFKGKSMEYLMFLIKISYFFAFSTYFCSKTAKNSIFSKLYVNYNCSDFPLFTPIQKVFTKKVISRFEIYYLK